MAVTNARFVCNTMARCPECWIVSSIWPRQKGTHPGRQTLGIKSYYFIEIASVIADGEKREYSKSHWRQSPPRCSAMKALIHVCTRMRALNSCAFLLAHLQCASTCTMLALSILVPAIVRVRPMALCAAVRNKLMMPFIFERFDVLRSRRIQFRCEEDTVCQSVCMSSVQWCTLRIAITIFCPVSYFYWCTALCSSPISIVPSIFPVDKHYDVPYFPPAIKISSHHLGWILHTIAICRSTRKAHFLYSPGSAFHHILPFLSRLLPFAWVDYLVWWPNQ